MIDKRRIHELEGATVHDRDGARVGTVAQVVPDVGDGHAAFASVHTGLLGSSETVVPLDDAELVDGDLHVGVTKSAIGDAPSLDADRRLSPASVDRVREHYGMSGVGTVTGDMGDPHEGLEPTGSDPGGAHVVGSDDTEGAGAQPPR